MKLDNDIFFKLYNLFFNNKYIRIDPSKNVKLFFYLKNLFILSMPSVFYQKRLEKKINSLNLDEKEYVYERVNYYNKLDSKTTLRDYITIQDFQHEKKNTYFFDLNKYLKYFPSKNKLSFLFGDITDIPKTPTIVKSRPITDENKNSIIMKLNSIRHFIYVNDSIKFEDKKDLLVWRGKAYQEHRKKFLEKFYEHPLCDVGQIKKKRDKGYVKWEKDKMALTQMLKYKFILAIEGNDVASNLKWAMSSNSLVFMVKPKYETWFMEGKLIEDYHYVLLKDDYSDLEEKIKYYSKNIKEAKKIIENANSYVKQFKDTKREDIISLLVLKKYFKYTS